MNDRWISLRKHVLLDNFALLNDSAIRMPFAGEWCKVWIYFGFVFAWTKGARPRFDTSTDMGLVLVPADAEVDSVIFRLRATDQDADFPLVFEITATITPVVRIDNLPCTLYNKVCQANVILTKRLVPGRLHDFAVRVRDTKGDSNSMQATISVTNATTQRDKIFPHIPSLIMVPEDTKPGKELDYLLVRANSWSGKPVYIELWQPKELFTIRQRQTPTQTRGIIILTGELDFETQSMYTLTMYATDPYTEQGKDTRNIAGLSAVIVVQDVQDVPPIFILAPPLTRINNSVQPGDTILRVHAEDGDKGVPREIVYGLVSEGNPFTPFFNISETSGEITLARPLEELTQITHVGAPVVLTVVAEEIRRSRDEPPAQATVVDVGFLLGEPGNSPPYFESDNYIATIDENPEPGTVINFGEQYSTKVKDEDIGKAGVFALKLENNNNTFEINPTVAERSADFIITIRDNILIDYELYKVLSFKIIAQEVGPATNLSASVPVTIFLRDINDNPPVFEQDSYEVTLSENVTTGSRVVQVHATDKDTGVYGSIRYTSITGEASKAFIMDPDTGLITVAMDSTLDRELAARLILCIEASDENGNGNKGVVPLIVNLLDVNDNMPMFEKDIYEFMLNSDLTNFTSPAFIKAIDADAEPPNNVVRYEIIHGNYENKFYLNETSGELILQSPITKIRRKKQSAYGKISKNARKEFVKSTGKSSDRNYVDKDNSTITNHTRIDMRNLTKATAIELIKKRRKRDNEDALYTLTARTYDLGVPHLSSETKIRILSGIAMEARIMMFVVPGEQPDSTKTAETLAAITGGRVTVLETRPYVPQNHTGTAGVLPGGGKKSIIVARVEQTEPGTSLVDVEKIRETLAANGVGIIGTTDTVTNATIIDNTKPTVDGTLHQNNANDGQTTIINNTITSIQNEEVTVYKAENKLLFWLLIILGLLMLLAIAALIICCICPGCPFYMAPRKRRVHSSGTLVTRADGRPKRHLHRQPAAAAEISWNGRKQAWSADPTRRNWQFNKRNIKNCSLPGDVAYISGQPSDVQMNLETKRVRDGPSYDHSRRSRMNEQDKMYMEDVEDQKARGYDIADLDSLQRHEIDRGSDLQHQAYRQRFMEPDMGEEVTVREQHFYREGNAEVLRLVTRGQVEDTTSHPHHPPHHHRSTTLIVDGKDIILQRFIEDQKSRHELSMQDIEAARSMESHQRSKEVCQQQQPEIILIPDRLELGHRQHIEEIGPTVQRLVIDHGDYGSQKMEKESQVRESLRIEKQEPVPGAPMGTEKPQMVNKDHTLSNNTQYPFHDLELARQNALLTRLLLERENRRAAGGAGMDSTSYLETQSLPGQVAIATQTDRTTATQTEYQVKSRSDNDESDEESKHRKKLRSRKRHGDGDWKRSRTLWMKSPIEEEGSPCFDKRLNILRKKVREVKEGRKILQPEVLREISDSLNGNGSSNKGEEDGTMRSYRKEQTSISYKILNEKESGSQSSEELRKEKHKKTCEDVTDDQKMNITESTSSPEIKKTCEKLDRERTDGRSPKKEVKSKTQQLKPSFRILEKEFTILTKKLSKLGDKKFQESTGSDSTSQEKSESFAKDLKKDADQKTLKKVDVQKQAAEGTPTVLKSEPKGKQKESAIARTKQKLKYQQTQVMSTGSSEYDDALDKSKKLIRQENIKQKQSVSSHTKVKRHDRRDIKKMAELRNEEIEKRKDSSMKEIPKTDLKSERFGKVPARAPKLAAIPRKQNMSDETSTSTEGRKDEKDFEKKSSTDLSERDSNDMYQRDGDTFSAKIVYRFSDDFIEEPKNEVTEEKIASSTKKEKTIRKKNVGTEKQLTDAVQISKNELERSKEPVDKCIQSEEHVSMKETIDVVLTMDKKLGEARALIQDNKAEEVKSPEKKSIIAEKPIKYEKKGTKNVKQIDETEHKIVKETEKTKAQLVRDKLDTYIENDKSLDDSIAQIEDESEYEIEKEKQKDKKRTEVPIHLEQTIKKFSESLEKKDPPLTEVKKIEQVQESNKLLKDLERDGSLEKVKKSDMKQKLGSELTIEIPIEEQSNEKGNEMKKIEESIEKYAEMEILNNGKNGTKEDEIHQNDKKEEKEIKHIDVSTIEPVTKEQKADTKEIIIDGYGKKETGNFPEEASISTPKSDDYPSQKNIFLDKKKDPTKDQRECITIIKSDEQKTESAFQNKTKEIADATSIAKDDKSIEEPIEDKKIQESIDHELDNKIVMEQKITEDAIKDHKINEKTTERYKVSEAAMTDDKIDEEVMTKYKIEQPMENHKVDEKTTEKYKIAEGSMTGDKIEKAKDYTFDGTAAEKHKNGKATGGYKIDEETTEDYKIEEATEDHTIEEEVTRKHKIEEAMKDHTTDEKITKDSKIEEETKDHNIDEKTAEEYKIDEVTKDHTTDEKVTKDSKIEEETKDHNIDEKTAEEYKIDEVTKDHTTDEKVTKESIIEEEKKVYAITGKVTQEHKLEEAMKDHITDEKITKEFKIEEKMKDRNIDEKTTADHKIDEVTKDHTTDEKVTKEFTIEDETKDHGIDEKVTQKHKLEETMKDHTTDEKVTPEHNIEEATKDRKIDEKVTLEHKIEKAMKDRIIDEKIILEHGIEETTKDRKIDEKVTLEHKIEETTKDRKIDEKVTLGHKIKEATKDRKINGKGTEECESEKATKQDTIDGKVTEKQENDEAIKDHKIDEKASENYKIDEKTTEEHKIKVTIKGLTVDETVTQEYKAEEHKIGEATKVHKIDKETSEDYKIEEIKEDHTTNEKPFEVFKIEEATKDRTTDERPTEAGEATREHKINERATDGLQITEEPTKDHRVSDETSKDHKSIEIITEDHKIYMETNDITTKDEISDKEKKSSAEVPGDKTIKGEAISLEKVTALTEAKMDDHQTDDAEKVFSIDKKGKIESVTSDDQSEKEGSTSLHEKEPLSEEETAIKKITSIDRKTSTDEPVSTTSKEETLNASEEKKEVDAESDRTEDHAIKEGRTIEGTEKEKHESKQGKVTIEMQNEEVNEEVQKLDAHKINKEIVAQTLNIASLNVSEKETIPESSTAEKELTKKQGGLSKIQDHGIKENIPTKAHNGREDHSPNILMIEEEENTNIDVLVSSGDNIKKGMSMETPTVDHRTVKKDGVLSEMFKAFHSLADKLTNGKESISADTDKKPAAIEYSPPNDVPSIHSDSKSSDVEISSITEPPIIQASEEFLELTEQIVKEDKTITGDKMTASLEDIIKIEKDLQVTTETDRNENIDELSKKVIKESEESTEKEEIDVSVKILAKKVGDKQNISEELYEKTPKVSKEDSENIIPTSTTDNIERGILMETPTSAEVPTNETIELTRTTEKEFHEPTTKVSDFQESELLETSPQTSTTTEKEKFVLDSIISQSPTDSAKIFESEKQLKSESEQTELQKIERFAEGQTCIVREDKFEPLLQEQPYVESDVPISVAEDKSDEQDITKNKIDDTLASQEDIEKEEPAGRFTDVSLPIFTSITDTMDDFEDSDSSSDISRKTTLTTRPYQTPRHRARQFSEKEGTQATEITEAETIGKEETETLMIGLTDDVDVESSEEKVELNIEHFFLTKEPEIMKDIERELTEEADSNKDNITAVSTESVRKEKETELRSSSKISHKEYSTKPKSGMKDPDDQVKLSSVSKIAKSETFKAADKKIKEPEKKRIPSQKKKKSTSEESSEEKATSRAAASHRYRIRKKFSEDQSKQRDGLTKQSKKTEEDSRRKQSISKSRTEKDKKSSSSEKHQSSPKTGEIDTSKAQPKYMAWYKKNREEMEKKRAELMATDDEEQLPRWLRRSMKNQKPEKEDKKVVQSDKSMDRTPRAKRKVKPLVNVESEQLKAIVRQGRKLRRAEGGKNEDPPVQIFASAPPTIPQASSSAKHHLVQHSEYKYEKMPAPFYLHPPPAPHPSPQLSPEHFEILPTMEHERTNEDFDSGIAVSLQGGNRLRHQQLLEKKSVFDIAYSEAAPSQLRSDSTTPPS